MSGGGGLVIAWRVGRVGCLEMMMCCCGSDGNVGVLLRDVFSFPHLRSSVIWTYQFGYFDVGA